ncbi:MAG: hypothetical protein J0G37_04805 [Afipia sp.]|nr:hypothetical protein [Afipia sp.]
MSIACKFERSLLSHDEYEVVKGSHHPELYGLDLAGLQALQTRLRQMRDKERTLARQKQRETRGKAEPRGGSFPGTGDQPQQRKQVFANALKRVNREAARIRNIEARAANVDAARRALAMRRAAEFTSPPPAGRTANEGMLPRPSRRRRTTVSRKRIGSISQATKAAQARRDSKGRS